MLYIENLYKLKYINCASEWVTTQEWLRSKIFSDFFHIFFEIKKKNLVWQI